MIATNVYILGASYPIAGEKPTVLQEISVKTKVLDWQLNSLKVIGNKRINFLGGYHIEDIINQYPEINYIIVKNWKSNTVLNTFFQADFEDTAAIFTYADTIFRPDIINKVSQAKGDITVAIDVNYQNRFEDRPKSDLRIAEIITPTEGKYQGCKSEFTGLFHLSHRIIEKIKLLKNEVPGDNLLDLFSYLKKEGFSIDFIDVGNNWAELNEPKDVARFVLGNKAETLSRLEPMVKKSKIGDQISFTVKKWKQDRSAIVKQIQQFFLKKRLIIRSSSSQEDGWTASFAGQYRSILNVDSSSSITIGKEIDKVISSYGEGFENDQVLVQEFLDDLSLSGVVFTCHLETGAPYHIFNFQDNQGSVEAITSGTSQDDRTIILYDKENQELVNLEPKLEPIQEAIDELKSLLSFDKLDIEFAIDSKGLVYIFQVRPITVDHRDYDSVASSFRSKLDESILIFSNHQESSESPEPTAEITTYFSNMSDWNPAEIIGIRPNPLSFSLYRFLITDDVWAKQRCEFGYKDLGAQPLILSFCGQPYVNLSASFKSFIPAIIEKQLASKLVKAYMGNLSKRPELHDKVEFDIALTSWTPNFKAQAESRLGAWNISSDEIHELEKSLKLITSNAIVGFDKHISTENLIKNRYKIFKKETNPLNLGYSLIEECKKSGTLAFAHAARHAFIAISFLKSFIEIGIFTKDEVNFFMESIDGVSSRMQDDQVALFKKEITLNQIIGKYGHLRPGTYDATAPAYWEDPEYYLKSESNKINKKPLVFELSKEQEKLISTAFKDLELDISPIEIMKYIKKAIIAREETKLEFTYNLSRALDCFIDFGKEVGITRQHIVYLEYEDFKRLAIGDLNINNAKKIIKRRMVEHKLSYMFEIPSLIKSKKDFYCFEHYSAQINFISNKKVIGELKNLSLRVEDDIDGKIIFIEQADPGYDWVFGHNILGLITKYGGANSHMAIRAAELGLPAAIGVGDKLFNKLSKSNKIKLDCVNNNIIIIN